MATHVDGLGGKLLSVARQMVCGLQGHDSLLQFERDRMYLRCVSCGHETPGWEISDTPRAAAASGAASESQTNRVLRPELISARRVA